MALLTLQDHIGYTHEPAAAGGDRVPQGTRAGGWDLSVVLHVINGDAAAKTVTIDGRDTVIAAGGHALIPVYGIYHGQPKDVTYSAVTSVTVAAVDLAHQ